MNNLELWDKVKETDPAHTKKAKIGGMNITAVAPQYQIMNATEQFGPYAVKWGFKKIDFDFSLVATHNLIVFKGTFFCPDGECQIVNSAKIYMNRDETMVDADFAKKMETDALTKVLSKMGFNADVFMGRYDDHRYVQDMQDKYTEKVDHSAIIAKFKACPDQQACDELWATLSNDQRTAINGALS